ncbi:phosphoribosylglycinamide formyltransferase [Reinekea marinisedimentorum]|uniref:Phosphoribosylglycinamide formyltransferase n=1 Tax=Reinekea marinisedimentorum TaxID=230495 RepID=A0A4R3I8P7_9GAMM|nr:phosphoribosylglycinamide formyltransferase [Reinekea marinisedimentorum]TCS42652.1 phosphoribosylglycinamide formyltransferase-1 [Reinekea marinisedimentorum]
MKNLVVLVSGSGSNLQAILDACEQGKINGRVSAVISNRPGVRGLIRAVQAGADAITIDHKLYASRAEFDAELSRRIDQYQPDFLVLAGFMRILTDEFVNRYVGKMVNIHPSLLPKYTGLQTHQRAIDAGDTFAGATVHYVTPELDGGPLIMQIQVAIAANDDALALSKRVLAAEHALYPQVIQWLCEGRLTLAEGIAHLDQKPLHLPVQMNNTSTC